MYVSGCVPNVAYANMCVRMFMYVYVCMYVSGYLPNVAYAHIIFATSCVYVSICICMYVCQMWHMQTCVYVCLWMYLCMYVSGSLPNVA